MQIPGILQIRKSKNSVVHICSSNIMKSLGKVSLSNEAVIWGPDARVSRYATLLWTSVGVLRNTRLDPKDALSVCSVSEGKLSS